MIDNDLLRKNRITVDILNDFRSESWMITAVQEPCKKWEEEQKRESLFHNSYDTFKEMVKEFNKFLKEFDAK